jgi:hypothetical protein
MAQGSVSSPSCSGGTRPSQIFGSADGAERQADASVNETLLIRRYENVRARKLLEQGCRPAEIRCQNINRIAGDPRREINRLINPGVKTDQYPTLLDPDVFNRVPIALWDVTDIARVQLLRSKSTVRAEHRHAEVAFDCIMPFIGVWMPMKFAQRAWFRGRELRQ